MTNWPFKDAANTAVFTSKRIVSRETWIYYVSHDKDDGAWQFHPPGGPTAEEQAAVVGLGTIVEIDPSVLLLADLPVGRSAWRESAEAPWRRSQEASL